MGWVLFTQVSKRVWGRWRASPLFSKSFVHHLFTPSVPLVLFWPHRTIQHRSNHPLAYFIHRHSWITAFWLHHRPHLTMTLVVSDVRVKKKKPCIGHVLIRNEGGCGLCAWGYYPVSWKALVLWIHWPLLDNMHTPPHSSVPFLIAMGTNMRQTYNKLCSKAGQFHFLFYSQIKRKEKNCPELT